MALLDRTVRIFGGIILLVEEQKIAGTRGVVMQGLGLYAVFTGFLGTCFAYHFLNFSTKR